MNASARGSYVVSWPVHAIRSDCDVSHVSSLNRSCWHAGTPPARCVCAGDGRVVVVVVGDGVARRPVSVHTLGKVRTDVPESAHATSVLTSASVYAALEDRDVQSADDAKGLDGLGRNYAANFDCDRDGDDE